MTAQTPYAGIDNLETMRHARRYNTFLADLVNAHAPPRGRILDFGAGNGTYSHNIAMDARDVVCVEPDSTLCAALARQGFEVHAGLDGVADGSCDYIYSLNVLEHIADDKDAAKQLFRALKPGGLCLIYVPALQVLFSSMDAKVGHVRRYDRRQLRGVLNGAGFAIRRIRYVDSIGFFAALAYKWFGSADGSLNRRGLILYDRLAFPVSRVFDRVLQFAFGKNLYAVVQKPEL